MFSPSGRRGKQSWSWLLRLSTLQHLLVLLCICLFLGYNFHFYNTTTRKYKDCSVPWATWRDHYPLQRANITVVTMSTGGHANVISQARQDIMNSRYAEFSGLLELTGPNKAVYAKEHGYSYVDASSLLNPVRPASWSKIAAALAHLADCDWLFWVDADTLITNTSTPLESFVPLPDALGPDLVLTEDSTGYNAGVWLLRNSPWSRTFLQQWWEMESFIRPAEDTKSGDNDALKHYLANLDPSVLAAHVGVAPQCAFNSYLWRSSLRNWLRYLRDPKHILTGLWQPGDFLMRPAGVHNKMGALHSFRRKHDLPVPVAGNTTAVAAGWGG